jgi:hypothetical protein
LIQNCFDNPDVDVPGQGICQNVELTWDMKCSDFDVVLEAPMESLPDLVKQLH